MGTKSFIDFLLSGVYCVCFINKTHAASPAMAKCLAALVYFPMQRLTSETNADLEFPTRRQHAVDVIFNHKDLWARQAQFYAPDDLCIAEGQRFASDRFKLKYLHAAAGYWIISYDGDDLVLLQKSGISAENDSRFWEPLDSRHDKKVLEHIALSKIDSDETVSSALNSFELPHHMRGTRSRNLTSDEYYEALLMHVLTNAKEFRSPCLGSGPDKIRITENIIQDAMIKHFAAR